MRLEVPRAFDLKTTVFSHGWYQLAPFRYDTESGGLSYVFAREGRRRPIAAAVTADSGALKIVLSGTSGKQAARVAGDGFARVLSLEHDLDEFHKVVRSDRSLAWIADANAGRLLRSSSVFEDLVKTICTTNCTWGLTKLMVRNLVDLLGEPAPCGTKAFPLPGAIAAMSEEFFRTEIKAGYRSPYILELSHAVAYGDLDPESWINPELTSGELRQRLLSVKGVGRYAAENMLKLLGHYDGLALDSFLRSEFYKKHNRGKKCPDLKIERHYKKFGKWRGLAMWFDMCGEN
jgi:N-glycosylase/DNA lyase